MTACSSQVYREAVPPAVVERAQPGLALRAEQRGSRIQTGQADGKRLQVRTSILRRSFMRTSTARAHPAARPSILTTSHAPLLLLAGARCAG